MKCVIAIFLAVFVFTESYVYSKTITNFRRSF